MWFLCEIFTNTEFHRSPTPLSARGFWRHVKPDHDPSTRALFVSRELALLVRAPQNQNPRTAVGFSSVKAISRLSRMGRFHFVRHADEDKARFRPDQDSRDVNPSHRLPLSNQSTLEHLFDHSGFDQSLRIDNVQVSIPILGREERGRIGSTVIMNRADSGMYSPTYSKQNIVHFDDISMPFPALTRRFEVHLVSLEHIGLVVSSGFAGIFTTCLKNGILPLLQVELKMQSYQVVAASVLILLPWSYSFIWGFISDAVPILASRRKAYIILGWITTMVACFVMALLDQYVTYRAIINDLTSAELLHQYEEFMALYIILLMLANFGCIVAIGIGQTYVLAQTRKERRSVRGIALGTLLLSHYIGELIGQFVADYSNRNLTDRGIQPMITLRQILLFCVFFSLFPLVALCLCFIENPDPPAIPSAHPSANHHVPGTTLLTSALELQRAYMTAANCFQRGQLALRGHWIRLQSALGKESTSRVMLFLIGFVLMSEFSLTYPIKRIETWCGMNIQAASVKKLMTEAVSLMTVFLWKYFFLNSDWRWCVFSCFIILTMTPQLVYYIMATLEPSARNSYVYAVVSGLTGFIRTGIVILQLAISAEIAPVGGEGAFLGMVVSMASSIQLLTHTVSHAIGFLFDVKVVGSSHDDIDRMQVAFALVLSYIIQVMALVALVFLPKQKRELQRLHRFGYKDDKCTTWWIIGCLAVSFIVSTVLNGLAIAPATSCMGIVGGSGC
ncbi:hypothetical protein CCR75_008612 [Bremia lactucae]|uniref:Transmembrane protein n=1 Tax=Bremia lactucae TaxID=4779 RepID=A0A976FMG4_BRELC|nr:hypothetical protein CCR75_008612 [Bremia lactucae]